MGDMNTYRSFSDALLTAELERAMSEIVSIAGRLDISEMLISWEMTTRYST